MVKYDSSQVKTLDGLSAIRKRPGMYVGSTTSHDDSNPRALIQIAQEVLSNAADEASAGFGDTVILSIHLDNSVTVKDHGRGLPRGKDFDAVRRMLTVPHSGAKFGDGVYSKSGGLHGVGLKATTALSEYVTVNATTQENEQYFVRFEQDEMVDHKVVKLSAKDKFTTGTEVTFMPDKTVFSSIDWDVETLKTRVDQQAYIYAGVKFEIRDERLTSDNVFIFEHKNGMQDLVNSLVEGDALVGFKEPLHVNKTGIIGQQNYTFDVELALTYVESLGFTVESFANGIPTSEGGPHENSAKSAVVRAINDYVVDKKLLKRGKLDASDIQDGLVIALAVGIPSDLLEFESQTKELLGTTAIEKPVYDVTYKALTSWLYDHNKQAKNLFERINDARSVREATLSARKDKRAARKVKGAGKLALSTKLTPARSKNVAEKELLVVEGDSAGGSAKRARDGLTQAVLPLRGKPLNVSGLRLSKILQNEEISTLLGVIGGGVGQSFDINKIQYDKLIIMTDADDDGAHIQELLILAVWVLMPDFIKQGHLYIANAPLFRFDHYVKGKREKAFALDDTEFKKMRVQYASWNLTRMKGLGEMDPDDLRITTLQKGTRHLTQVTVSDAIKTHKMLDTFLGQAKSSVSTRRSWIEKNVDFSEVD